MNCPKCGYPQTCPCPSCQARTPTSKPWVWVDGEFIKCGNCDLVEHCDWWMDVEYEYYESLKKGNEHVNIKSFPETSNSSSESDKGA